MLFPRNALPSGPQACFLAEKRIAKIKGGKLYKRLDKRVRSLFNQLEFLWESSKDEKFSAPLTSLVSLARINQVEDRFL
jgi:hypothetical protein